MSMATVTGSIETAAEPAAVLAILADPQRLPQWAPGFADAVAGDERQGFRVVKDGQSTPIRIAAAPASGTVDYIRRLPSGREGGAYLRVVPGPTQGSVVVMTLPVAPGADPAVVAGVLAEELAALVGLAGG